MKLGYPRCAARRWLFLLLGIALPALGYAADLTSPSFRLRGANLNQAGAASLQSTAPLPRFSGSGISIGQSEALGFSGSTTTLTSSAPGFWPLVGGFPNIDVDGDGIQSFVDDDDDGDGLLDVVETGTGVFSSPADTGTNPVSADTDGDGFSDGAEVAAGSDPNDAGSTPILPRIPGLPGITRSILIAMLLIAMTLAGRRRRRGRVRC